MSGVGPLSQDWEPTAAARKDDKAVNAARRAGADIETMKKHNAATNRAASSSTSLNTKRLDEDTENLALDDDDNKNDSATPQPPPKKPRLEEPISPDDDPVDDDKNELEVGNSYDPNDAAARVTFQRWCRYIRPEGKPDGYRNNEEKERGFQNFKTYWLHKEDEHDCPLLDRFHLANLFYLADLSPEEFKSHPHYSYPASFCHISNELLDEFDEISSVHDDFFDRPVYS